MKKKFKITTILLASLIFLISIRAQASNTNSDPEKDKILIYILRNILTRSHFVVKDMNDDFSEYVFNEFINGLDPNKRYFTQNDIKLFSKFKYEIDNNNFHHFKSYYGDIENCKVKIVLFEL